MFLKISLGWMSLIGFMLVKLNGRFEMPPQCADAYLTYMQLAISKHAGFITPSLLLLFVTLRTQHTNWVIKQIGFSFWASNHRIHQALFVNQGVILLSKQQLSSKFAPGPTTSNPLLLGYFLAMSIRAVTSSIDFSIVVVRLISVGARRIRIF